MFNKKIKLYFINFKLCLYIWFHYSSCSSEDFMKNELIQLTSIQKNNLDKMLEEIYPKYKLTTYLIDPNNLNICYLFIENTISNEISYFTNFLNDDNSLQHIKNIILHDNLLENNTFDECYGNLINIQYEIDKFKSIISSFNIVKFNSLMKLIFCNFFVLIDSVDRTNFFKLKIKYDTELCNNEPIHYILNNLKIILCISNNLSNSDLTVLNPQKYNSVNLKNLERFINARIYHLHNFNLLSYTSKIDQTNKLTTSAYYFCKRKKILTNHVIKYVLIKINEIENKLNKYTFMLCFIKIFNDSTNLKMKNRMLKLLILILLLLNKSLTDLNNEGSLTLLYHITIKCNQEFLTKFAIIKMCFLENYSLIYIKKILIYRYTYFIFTHQIISYIDNENLFSFWQYSELIWLIIKSCIISAYKIFHVDL